MEVLISHNATSRGRKTGLEESLRAFSAATGGDPSTDFVLTHGRVWSPGTLPKRYQRRRSRECWGNSQLTLLNYPRLTYVEGYARRAKSRLIMAHAWLVDDAGTVIDSTWNDPENVTYFGVPISTGYVAGVMVRRKVCWSLIDHRYDDWPLVDGRQPIADAVLTTFPPPRVSSDPRAALDRAA